MPGGTLGIDAQAAFQFTVVGEQDKPFRKKVETPGGVKAAVGSVKPDDLKRAVWPEVTLKPGVNTITATASIGGKTVSYTHLDVYKRQGRTCPVFPVFIFILYANRERMTWR